MGWKKLDLPYLRARTVNFIGSLVPGACGEWRGGKGSGTGEHGCIGFILPREHHPQKNGVSGPCHLPRQGKTDEKQ